MRCPACGFENASGIKFCGECGASLKIKCSSCGFENAPAIKFCGECGKPLGEAAKASAHLTPAPTRQAPRRENPHSRSALEGERKQVTSSSPTSKDRWSWPSARPGGVAPHHGSVLPILAEGVHRFEGTVNEYRGDGIMALFGAPIAHEDHAQRACYARFHLREALRRYANELRLAKGVSFSVRMGLNSGEVVVWSNCLGGGLGLSEIPYFQLRDLVRTASDEASGAARCSASRSPST